VLFVVARALDASGQPSGAPLAVIRTEAGAWPLAFSLDDAQAMSPASRLSAQPPGTRIAVIARLSRTGEAALRTGDLLGSSAPVMAGAQDVLVRIDSVAP
jgi:cytochrome c-type biogenesis protein CcmH